MLSFQMGVLCFSDPCLKNVIRAQQHTKYAATRRWLRFHLATRIANKNYLAILLKQRRKSLVVADTTIGEANYAIGIEQVHRDRFKYTWHRRRRTYSMTKSDSPMLFRRVRIVHATQTLIAIDLGINSAGRFSHP